MRGPTLVDVARDRRLLSKLEYEDVTSILVDLGAIQTALAARMTEVARPEPEADRLLTVEETAARLGVSTSWLYSQRDSLPFAVKLGPKQLRFSARGIADFIKDRSGSSEHTDQLSA